MVPVQPKRALFAQHLNRLLRRAGAGGSKYGLPATALVTTLAAGWRLQTASATETPSRAAAPAAHLSAGRSPSPIHAWRGTPEPGPPRGAGVSQPNTRSPGATLAALRNRVARAEPFAPAAEVERWILRLATRPADRAWLEQALGRMAAYEPLVRSTLQRHGAPEELLYVALIESQFKSTAVSHAGAAGMWQFMAGTGRSYDLEVSSYVDERLDPVRSTDAAVRHLADLHREFGSWHLALAAYNAGTGRISGALRQHADSRRGDEVLYWKIRPYLPRETRTYVPLFLAAAAIARDPGAFGLHPQPSAPLAFEEIWVDGGVSLADLARARGVPPETLTRLNSHLTRGVTPPGRRWPVRIPRAPQPESGG